MTSLMLSHSDKSTKVNQDKDGSRSREDFVLRGVCYFVGERFSLKGVTFRGDW